MTSRTGIAGPATLDYLDKAVDTFFKRFRHMYDLTIVEKWRRSETLHFMLAGDKDPARELARWLVKNAVHHLDWIY
jgi:hypothetical protein